MGEPLTAVNITRTPLTRFLAGGGALTVTMLAVAAANYVLNFLLARILTPQQFGDIALTVTILLLSSVVAATLQFIATRAVAAHPDKEDSIRSLLLRFATITGSLVCIFFIATAPLLSSWFHTSTPVMFVVLGVTFPLFFVQATYRGVLQAHLRFPKLVTSYVVEAVARIVLMLTLTVAGFGVTGATVGLASSYLVSLVVTVTPKQGQPHVQAWPYIKLTTATTVLMLLGQTFMNNVDVVLAKAMFDAEIAGVYAAAGVIGRAFFLVTWPAIQILIPLIASPESTPESSRKVFSVAVAGIVAAGTLVVVVLHVGGGWFTTTLFGSGYAGAAPLIAPYAAATVLVTVSTLLTAVSIAKGHSSSAVVLVGAALLTVVLLLTTARTPEQFVWVQLVVAFLTVATLTVVHRFQINNPTLST